MGIQDIEILTLIHSEDGQVIRLSCFSDSQVSLETFTSNYIYKRETFFSFTRHALGIKIPNLSFSLNLVFRYYLKSADFFNFFFFFDGRLPYLKYLLQIIR